ELAVGTDDVSEPGENLAARLRADALVVGHLAGVAVRAHDDRHDLVAEPAGVGGPRRPAVGLRGEGGQLLAPDLPAVGDDLARLALVDELLGPEPVALAQ